MTDLAMCDRDETHGLAAKEIRCEKPDHRSRPVYLCEPCAQRIDPTLAPAGITVTITPIRSEL